MITFDNVTLRRGKHVLLEKVQWTIYAKQRIGIIGKNGTGKTSLLSMLKGELEPDIGSLHIPKQIHIASVDQEHAPSELSALAYVLQGDVVLHHLQTALKKAEDEEDGHAVATLHEKIAIHDGYTAESRAAQLLVGLGFNHSEQQRKYRDFSGGWQMRLNLAKALMAPSEILLLDEPTNHLDLDAVIWLEEWLNQYSGTLIMISHDREFLDKTVNHIVYLAHQQLKLYTGNYSTFEQLYTNEILVQQASYEKQQKHLAHLQSFVDRFRYKASKAKQAQSRLKAIERMDKIEIVQQESDFRFSFRKADSLPTPMITLDKVSVGYGGHCVLDNISMSFNPNDRIALIGPNGAGKSTFIKMLAGEVAIASGSREIASGLKIGYFAQHQVEHLRLNETALQHLSDLAPNESEKNLRTFLGTFGFIGDRVFDEVSVFSGGEKARLALSLIVWQKPNLLLMDEPTNHLDLSMREALSIALQSFEGAMLLVSHDRFLIRTTVDQLLLVANQKVELFDGDLDDYQNWLQAYRKQDQRMQRTIIMDEENRKDIRKRAAAARAKVQPLQAKIREIENKLENKQNELMAIERLLADVNSYLEDNKENLKANIQQQANLKKEIDQLEESWLSACAERDSLDT